MGSSKDGLSGRNADGVSDHGDAPPTTPPGPPTLDPICAPAPDPVPPGRALSKYDSGDTLLKCSLVLDTIGKSASMTRRSMAVLDACDAPTNPAQSARPFVYVVGGCQSTAHDERREW